MPFYKRHGAITPVASAEGIQTTLPNIASLFGKGTAKLTNGGHATVSIETNGVTSYSFPVVRTYDASGSLVSQQSYTFQTRPNTPDAAITALPGGGWAMAFTQFAFSTGGLYVVTSGGGYVQLQANVDTYPHIDIATLADGGFAVSWSYNSGSLSADVFVQRFSSTGAAVGDAVILDGFGSPHSSESSVIGLAGGGYLVTWSQTGSDFQVMGQLFGSGGTKVGAAFVVNGSAPGQQSRSSTAALPDGGFVASWVNASDGAVTLQIFDANGNKVGSEFVAGTFSGGVSRAIPELDVLANGEIVVGWNSANGVVKQSYQPLSNAAPADLELSRSTVSEAGAEGVAIAAFSVTEPVNLPASGGFTYSIISDSSGGAFGMSGDRLVVVDRHKLDYETSQSATVTVRVQDGSGYSYDETFTLAVTDAQLELIFSAGDEITVNTSTTGGQYDPSVARLGSGWIATWTDASGSGGDTSGTAIRGQKFDTSGAKVGSEFLVNSQTASNQDESVIVQLASGNMVAVWTDRNHPGADGSGAGIRGQLLDPQGGKIGGEFLVNTQVGLAQIKPAVAPLANGSFAVTWFDQVTAYGGPGNTSGFLIKGQLFDSSGAKVGAEFVANSVYLYSSASTPAVSALADGSFVIAWDDHKTGHEGIFAQRFSPSGAKLGGEFAVSAGADYMAPAIAGLGGGTFVVSWSEGGDVRARIYDAAGAALGAAFEVASTTAGIQEQPAIAALDSGLFVIAWVDGSKLGSDAGGGNVRAQVFTADGLKVGDEFVVNTNPGGAALNGNPSSIFDGHASIVTVAASAGGGFVVSWSDDSIGAAGDGSGGSVKARHFSVPDFAADDAVTVNEQSTTAIPVQANDSGATPGISTINGIFVQAGQSITLRSGAVVTLNADGTLSYNDNGVLGPLVSPGRAAAAGAVNGSATDSFVYTLAAGGVATVNVTVNGADEPGDLLIFGEGNDTYRSSSGSERMDGRGGNDTFLLQDGGSDHAFGGAGDDGFFFGAALGAGDVVDGGLGSDQVGIQGDYAALTLDAANFAGIETFAILAGNDGSLGSPSGTYSYNITTSGSFGREIVISMSGLLAGESVTFDGSAEATGTFIFFGSAGTEDLTGGAKDDGFFFGEGRFGSADRIDGGGGIQNQLGLRGDYTIDFGHADYSSTLTNIQSIALISATDPRYLFGGDGEFDFAITLGDGLVSGTSRFSVSGFDLNASETMVVDGSGETTGTLRLIGGAAADTLTGGGGNDQLFGGLGADTLTGNGGADTFIYTAVAQSGGQGIDQILGFVTGTDKLDLSAIDANSNAGGNQAFTLSSDGSFHNTPGELRTTFDVANSRWVVDGDVNGDGVADFTVHVTTFGNAPLGAGDFIF